MVLTYRKAAKSDANLLIDIYNASFYEDYIHYGECPGYGKTKEQMESSIRALSKYIVSKDGIPVGVISFENKGNGSYHIGCLCVIPAYQRQGIGSRAFRYMLSVCPRLEAHYSGDSFGQGEEPEILYRKMRIQHRR